ASGKTKASIEIAKLFGGEIISADSMQIYKGIHVASAAPDEDEMQGIPHHLIEFLELNEEFSVADYVKLAREKIKEINSRGKLPVIVGGTGLYISSLLYNIEFTDHDVDQDLRSELEAKFDAVGGEEMLRKLSSFDSDSANRLHPNNRRRIIRAFEVYLQTGKTITEQNILSKQNKSEIEPLIIGINFTDRQKLYDRINLRVDLMINNGLLDEAKLTYNMRNNKGAFQAIGHKELYDYFDGNLNLEQAVENLKMQTRRYAKRQLTWFKRVENVRWFYPDNEDYLDNIITTCEQFLKEE
ncbi:MAG: tRNA (adenosine(37)-N6)-dimethylallyltransferase MiaA, partial [Clostridia bacterium]|nr:tRNA (adenosine(37)-N6)-dimethylallyltransferase MiaA [Clostridia bacterium]